MSTVRYPSEFQSTPNTDYMQIELIIKDYSQAGNLGQDGVSTYNQSGVGQYKVVGDPSTLILNMPQRVTEQISQDWRNSALGPEASAMFSGRSTVGKNLGTFAGDTIRRLIENSLLSSAVSGLGKLGASNINENAILSGTSGIIYNPMLEVLYDGPQFRQFNFQFVLFAKSEKDAQAIKKIVRFFQIASVPSYNGQVNGPGLAGVIGSSSTVDTISNIGAAAGSVLTGGNPGQIIKDLAASATKNAAKSIATAAVGNSIFAGGINNSTDSRFIKQPPLLRITYKRGPNQHPYILPLKPCAITNMNIDYTPTGNYTVLDNFGNETVATVVATNITLGLTEVKTIFNEDYYDNGVSFNRSV
jgi:hypothetical protein